MRIALLILLLFLPLRTPVVAQDTGLSNEQELELLIQKARNTAELEKLNDVRIRLRQIEFARLPSMHAKELYAEAYLQLAMAHRNNKYIRPGYEIYQKYISLKDTLIHLSHQQKLDSAKQAFNRDILNVNNRLAGVLQEFEQLNASYQSVESMQAHFMTYCTLLTLILAAIFVFFYMKLSKSVSEARQSLDLYRSKLKSIYPDHIRARMYAALITHLKSLNETVRQDFDSLKIMSQHFNTNLNETTEVKPVLKQISDNGGRIEKLIEINDKTLSVF